MEGYKPSFFLDISGQVAQLVEQRTENPRVGGSIPSLATRRNSPQEQTLPSKRPPEVGGRPGVQYLKRRRGLRERRTLNRIVGLSW